MGLILLSLKVVNSPRVIFLGGGGCFYPCYYDFCPAHRHGLRLSCPQSWILCDDFNVTLSDSGRSGRGGSIRDMHIVYRWFYDSFFLLLMFVHTDLLVVVIIYILK